MNLVYMSLVILVTMISMSILYYAQIPYFFSYLLFISALIVSLRTDVQWMLISRFVTLYLIPVGYVLAYFNALPLTVLQSLIGSISAYCVFFLVGYIFHRITNKEGLGQGDTELLAFIGAFTGLYGWWTSLLIGSLLGSVIGISYGIMIGQYKYLKIPFGPFLTLGAIIHTLLSVNHIMLLPFAH